MKQWSLLCALVLAACSGAPAKNDKVSDPPEGAEVRTMPEGPEIVDDSIHPRETRPTDEADGTEAQGASGVVNKAEVAAFMRRGPSYVLTQVVVDPVHGKAGFEGYKIASATQSVESFMAPQLKLGDVVTHLNGVKIERPDDYLQAWNRLKDADVLSVNFVREGQKLSAQWRVE